MPNMRQRPSRRVIRMNRRVLLSAFTGLSMAFVAACHGDGAVAPLPPGDGALTGTWIQPSIDTWVQLDLSQSGARVVGYYRTGSANFGGGLSNPIPVTGTAALPQVTLQWTDGGVQWTMNATLSTNGDTLNGEWSASGQPATTIRGFHRSQ